MTDQPRDKPVLVCDIETFHQFFLVAFKRLKDGKIVTFEQSDRSEIDRDRLRSIMLTHTIVTYNGMSYDVPLIFYALDLLEGVGFAAPGEINAKLKSASDRIIQGGVKYWEVEQLLGIAIPRNLTHIDLIEPQPNAWASLKTLQGRLHGKTMRDLPFHHDAVPTHADMDNLTSYCVNDLQATENLYNALKEPLELRAALGAEYGMNFMSKSDSQIGEAIVKKRVEQITGERIERVNTVAGTSFPFRVPEFMQFERPDLREILDRLRTAEFFVKADGKVDMPQWLSEKVLTIGETTYAMGIGGLHSTEANRASHSDGEYFLRDFDVRGYYPRIIINSRLYPKSIGPHFVPVFTKIVDDRDVAKIDAANEELPKEVRSKAKVKAEGLKISSNGTFGKLNSRYSALYAPHLMIATTLTGQLSLLMLIERAEAEDDIQVISANTDGVVFRCRRDKEDRLAEIAAQWERDTGFTLESTDYQSLYNLSVNTYIAIKPDGKVKRKGTLSNPYKEGMREQLMKNPNMGVCSDAVVEFLTKGTPIDEYIRSCRDIRDFVTVVNVKGGGTWRGEYLGKVVRYIWSTNGTEILYKDPHPTTGNYKKVPKSDGSRPVMDLPDEFPSDIDYDAYIAAAREILMDIGANERPPPIKPLRFYKWSAIAWFAVAV